MVDRRKIIGGMLVLTLAGFFGLVPPVVYLFNHDFDVFGVPQIVFYLFGIWVALIAGTALLTARLGHEPAEEQGDRHGG
jgi:hypothetical protein